MEQTKSRIRWYKSSIDDCNFIDEIYDAVEQWLVKTQHVSPEDVTDAFIQTVRHNDRPTLHVRYTLRSTRIRHGYFIQWDTTHFGGTLPPLSQHGLNHLLSRFDSPSSDR